MPESVEKILLVDDDSNILSALQRQFRNKFSITSANGGTEALQLIDSDGPFAVIVSDLHMPDLDGLRFLAQARQKLPNAIPLLLSGNADLHTALAALNEGRVFRFLTKPCPGEVFGAALQAALEKYRMDQVESQILEQNLGGDLISALRAAQEQAGKAEEDLSKLMVEAQQAARQSTSSPSSTADEIDGPKFAFHHDYSGGVVDTATGLPDWKTADTALRAAFTGPNPPYLAIFYVQRVDFASARYGTAVGNHILLTASQYLASQMEEAPFFRWKGPILLALIGAAETASTVRSSLQHLVAATRPEYFQTPTRSVFLRVKIEFSLLEGPDLTPEKVFEQINQFSKRMRGT
jgi:CheY-like chemotaxis protein